MIFNNLKTYFCIFICTFFLNTAFSQGYPPVQITVECNQGSPGETVCFDFTVEDFNDVSGVQFTISFNSLLLRPLVGPGDIDFGSSILPNLSLANLNLALQSQGLLSFLWFEGTGVSAPDGSLIISLCFEIIGNPGETATITITNNPIPFEIVQTDPISGNTTSSQIIEVIPCESVITANMLTFVSGYCEATPGQNDGNIWFYGSGGTPPYNWTVTGPAGFNQSGSSALNERIDLGPLAQGFYTINLTDASGASVPPRLISITDNNPITFDLVGQAPSCFNRANGSVVIENLTGGAAFGVTDYAIEWSNNRYNTPENLAIENGTYTVTISDRNGCTATGEATIFVDTLRAIVEILDSAFCAQARDGRIRVTALGGVPNINDEYRFRINTAAPLTGLSPYTIENVRAGQNSVRVTDFASPPCTIDEILIDMPFKHVVEFEFEEIINASCDGDGFGTVRVRAIDAPSYAYSLRNTDTGENILSGGILGGFYINDQLPPGNYEIRATIPGHNNQCAATASFTIGMPLDNIILNTIEIIEPSCTGEDGSITVEATQGSGGFVYLWSTGETGNSISGINGGVISVTVTDAANCTAEATFNMPMGGDLTLNPVVVQTVRCRNGTDGILRAVVNLTANVSFEWRDEASNIVGTSELLENVGPGTYSVTVRTPDCEATASVFLLNPEGMEFSTVNITEPQCPQEDFLGSLGVSITGGSPQYSYEWRRAGETDLIGGQSVLASIRPGFFEVIVRDQNDCQIDTILELPLPQSILVDITDIEQVRCFGTGSGTATAFASGGTVNATSFSFVWSSSPDDGGSGTSNTAVSLPAGTNWVIAVDTRCASDTIFFDVPNTTPIQLSQNDPTEASCHDTCDGAINVLAIGGNPSSYSYILSETNEMGTSFSNLCPGIYNLVVTDGNACTQRFDLEINAPDSLELLINTNLTIDLSCRTALGQIAVFTSGGNEGDRTFIWDGSSSNSNLASDLPPGIYGVTVTDSRGCTATLSYEMAGVEAINAEIPTPEMPNCFGETTCLTVESATGGVGGNYTFAVNRGTRFQLGECVEVLAGNYVINVFDSEGCNIEYEIQIEQPEEILVFLPDNITIDLGEDSPLIVPEVISQLQIQNYLWTTDVETEITCMSDNCSRVIITPIRDTRLRLVVVDENGCQASDQLFIRVSDERRVYFPNVFTPDRSGLNARFNLAIGRGTREVEFFHIYDRYGNLVYERTNFVPNGMEEEEGWDGTFLGRQLNPGVFTYIARVSFLDDQIRDYKGTVTLLR
jgi:gliding motility-associated-like protein